MLKISTIDSSLRDTIKTKVYRMFGKSRPSLTMSTWIKNRVFVLALVLLVTSVFQVSFTWTQYGDNSYSGQGVIKGDGRGYYDYLTSIFIDDDLDHQIANGRTIVETEGGAVNKYYSGSALLMLPFFLTALLFAHVSGSSAQGFEIPFQFGMALAALFYMLIGLIFIYKTLSVYRIKPTIQSIIIIVIGLGTNLLFYVSEEITYAHNYSFFAIAVFTYNAIKYFQTPNLKNLLWASAFFGLTVLIRPVDGLVFFSLPFLSTGKNAFLSGIKFLFSKLHFVLTAIAVIFLFVFVQLLLYKAQTDHWVVWSYANEGFYFSNPAFFKFLLSFKRGWLIFTPFFLLLIPSMVLLFKQKRFAFWSFLLFFIGVVYILSSWWTWHYGGSFGSRPMIDFYAILVIPIGLFINSTEHRIQKLGVISFLMLCILLNFIQSYQANRLILPSLNLNADAYFWAFGKLGSEHSQKLGGRSDIKPYHHSETIIYEGEWLALNNDHWTVNHIDTFETIPSAVYNEIIEYNVTFRYEFTEAESDRVFLELELDRKEYEPNAASKAFVVIRLKDSTGKDKYYDSFKVNDRPDLAVEQWKRWFYQYNIPVLIDKDDKLVVYVWNKELTSFNVRQPKLKLIKLN